MKKYTSRYAELSFYVEGKERKFSAGVYVASTPEEIAVLNRLVDAIPVDEAPKTEEPAAKETPVKEDARAPKTPRKASASSDK